MALPASDDDILQLLEISPTLKGLLDLPARVAALEAKVRKLEGGSAPKARAVTNPCPFCQGQLKLTGEVDDLFFGAFGVKERTYECETCHKVTTRKYDPSKDGP